MGKMVQLKIRWKLILCFSLPLLREIWKNMGKRRVNIAKMSLRVKIDIAEFLIVPIPSTSLPSSWNLTHIACHWPHLGVPFHLFLCFFLLDGWTDAYRRMVCLATLTAIIILVCHLADLFTFGL
jgi:hypothetical protein